MALIGLFCANHPGTDGSGEPTAWYTVGGIPLLERNLRLALRAGAERLIVLAEDKASATAADFTGLCRRYPQLEVVNHAEELPGKVEADDRVLLIEEGFAVDSRLVSAVAGYADPAVMAIWHAGPSVPDQAVRLTAQFFSAAVSVVPGQMIRRVAKGLGDWDFEQTLLRAVMVELPVRYVDAGSYGGFDPLVGRDVPLLWHAVQSEAAVARVDKILTEATDVSGGDAPTRWIYAPLSRWIARQGARVPLDSRYVAFGGAGAGLFAAIGFALGWFWLGCILALVTGLAGELSRRLEYVRLDSALPAWLRQRAPAVVEAGWYLGLCVGFGRLHGMAALAVALLLLVCRFSADLHKHYHRRLFQTPLDDGRQIQRIVGVFGSGPQTNMWFLGICGIFGVWYPGFWIVSAYSALTYALVLAIFVLSLKQLSRGIVAASVSDVSTQPDEFSDEYR